MHAVLGGSEKCIAANPSDSALIATTEGEGPAIEAVACKRHSEGLPGLAVQWGPIGDAGYLARETQVSEMLSKQLGGAHLTAAEALDTLPAMLASGAPVVLPTSRSSISCTCVAPGALYASP